MLADLFKPAWKSRSVEKRLRAISVMDSACSEKQEILSQLAAEDEEVSICIAATQKLTVADALHELSTKHANDSVREEAEKRLNELMSSASALNEAQYRDLFKRYPELKSRIAAYAGNASVRTEAIASLSAQQLIAVLGLTVFTDSRQQAAERLINIEENIETLESARKTLRGKDKKAERTLKAKIDELRRQQRQHAENLAIVEKLIEEVEYLASHDWRAEFKAKLLAHRSRWDKLGFEIDAAAKQRYQTARKTIDDRFEEQGIIEQARQSQQQLLVEMEAFLQATASRDLDALINTLAEMQAKQNQYSERWQQLAVNNQPDAAAHDQYGKMLGALQSVTQLALETTDILKAESITGADEAEVCQQTREAEKLAENSLQLEASLKKLKWPSVYGELKAATELQALLAGWRKAQKQSAAEREQELDRIHKKISSIFRFSRAGNLTAAKQFCEKVEKALDQFEGKERTVLDERFEEARKTLGDMGDWKNFATEPKYIALCEAMERLAESSQNPDKRSAEMKKLQQQWKALGHSDVSEQYWPRFKLAADKVYQPCAEFFDKRRQLRKTHLEQRQLVVDQMQKLFEETDWDNSPDYKAVLSSMRSISDNFASIKDVEHKPGQKQWKQFSALKGKVNAKLDVVYDANIKLKHELIKQAEGLAGAAANEENLVKLKSLQARWKQVGMTRRNQDQKAWTEFKKQGDIVYNNVQALRQAQRNETDQQLDAYRAIIKDIQNLASTAKELTEADHQFSVLQNQYAELPELPAQLPEKLAEGIQRDYRNACDLFDECHSRIINSKHAEQVAALRQKAELCAQLESLGESPSAQQLEDISQQWDAISLDDPVLSRRIEKRRNSAGDVIDRTTIGEERRMLCIQLEIALGAESPAEDKALRMQYQLEQMNKSGLGLQAVNNSEWLENMELDWLCMPGAEPNQQKALDERFQRAIRSE